MTRFALPLAVAGMMAAVPALAQNNRVPVDTTRPIAQRGLQNQIAVSREQDVVLAVEQRLRDLGYAVRPDGRFDADLRNSVLLFQSDHGLRPTGNVDLTTLAALGIDVDPSGRFAPSTAMVEPEPGDQMAMAPANEPDVAVAAARAEPARQGVRLMDGNYPMFKDEHMSSPTIASEVDVHPWENIAGVPQPPSEMQLAEVPGLYPFYAEQH